MTKASIAHAALEVRVRNAGDFIGNHVSNIVAIKVGAKQVVTANCFRHKTFCFDKHLLDITFASSTNKKLIRTAIIIFYYRKKRIVHTNPHTKALS